jgi:hypothetical protein
MQQKFNIAFAHFAYGGNGGISSETPDIREWQVPLVCELSKDPRIDQIRIFNISDTPITMSRNQAIIKARQAGVDVLVMVDSDMKPDMYAGQPGAKPFFASSFDFLVSHYHKGPCVIGAPYCGPPPKENVYVFKWENQRSHASYADFQLQMYERHEAAKLAGIQDCAALPTGLIMFDMRCFDIIEPKGDGSHSFAYYEWRDKYAAEKASTEDVTMTRDLSLAGAQKLGYNPVYCNWDAWAGHWKPLCVGKPIIIEAKGVSEKLKEAWEAGYDGSVKLVNLPAADWISQIRREPEFDGMGMETPAQDLEALQKIVGRFIQDTGKPPTVLEVGSWAGRSALAMKQAGAKLVMCVDTWQGSVNDNGTKQYDGSRGTPMEVFLRNVEGVPGIGVLVGKSPDIAGHVADQSYDIVYIDAEHDYDSVMADIAAWKKKAKCILAGHDYHTFEGVRKAVKDSGLDPVVVGNVWHVRL